MPNDDRGLFKGALSCCESIQDNRSEGVMADMDRFGADNRIFRTNVKY